MRWLPQAVVACALALTGGACGDDDDKKTDTGDTSATEVTTTDAATETSTPDGDATVTDTEDPTETTTSADADATTGDTEVVDPPMTFPEFVIDLIENETADDTEAVPYSTFSTLEDDETQTVFDPLFD